MWRIWHCKRRYQITHFLFSFNKYWRVKHLHFTVWSRQSKRRRNRNSSSRILLLVILLTSCHSIYSLTHALCLFVLICYVILCLLRYVTLTYHHRQIYLLWNGIKLLFDESIWYCKFMIRYVMSLNQYMKNQNLYTFFQNHTKNLSLPMNLCHHTNLKTPNLVLKSILLRFLS